MLLIKDAVNQIEALFNTTYIIDANVDNSRYGQYWMTSLNMRL